MDCLIHSTICKHIHMVVKYERSTLVDNDRVVIDEISNKNTTNDTSKTETVESGKSSILAALQHKHMDNLSNMKETLKK